MPKKECGNCPVKRGGLVKKSQCVIIIEHMQKGNRITQLECTRLFGCTRLAARIGEIKKNHAILRRTITVPSGKKVKEYWLANDQLKMAMDINCL